MKRFYLTLLSLLCAAALCGCSGRGETAKCTVVFEENASVHMNRHVFDVPRGEELTVTVSIARGERIDTVSVPGSTVSAMVRDTGTRKEYEITLRRVRYPTLVRLSTAPDFTTNYVFADGSTVTVTETTSRLRVNSLPYPAELRRDGFLPIGWRVQGTQETIGFGSRFDHTASGSMTLEPVWLPCSPEADFQWRTQDGGAVITAWQGRGDPVLPDTLGGLRVMGIDAGAFGAVQAETIAFPPTLEWIAPGAFAALTVENLHLFDNLETISDAAFGNAIVQQLHIHAAREPVYCGSYFDALSEKIDYLVSKQAEPKIVLFCGSSARFGYDSALIEAAFPDYRVVNLGVYAYANMHPQAQLVQQYLNPGDILLSSPELDAIDTQFCGSRAMERETFAMMESNYDMLARIDCSEYTGIFDAFADYQRARRTMQPRSYADVPASFDEDGNRREVLTYNRQGDYILYRESNLDRKLFGVKRAFYNAGHITEADWQGLNAFYDALTAQGVRVFFTYSPRSERSISPDSDAASIAALDAQLRQRLHAPVISQIENSLMDAVYFYGTDNHLSTEGVQLHTEQVISDLRRALEVGA